MKYFCCSIAVVFILALSGCASLTNDAFMQIAFSFSDGSNGECQLQNKRWAQLAKIPATVMVRRSDDALLYTCKTDDGRRAVGAIASRVGSKIVASAVFLDFGIIDAITDKHREYPLSFVIPVASR